MTRHDVPDVALANFLRHRLDPVLDAPALRSILGAGRKENRLEELASEMWREQALWGDTFEALLPGLADIASPSPLEGASVRTHNVLMRCGLASWAAIAEITPGRLSSLPNYGRKSFNETIEMMLLAWAQDCRDGPKPPAETASGTATSEPEEQSHSATLEQELSAAFELLAWLWRETGAETIGAALASWASTNPPTRMEALAEDLLGTRLDEALRLTPPDEAAWQALLDLPDRELDILRGRLYPDARPLTLVQLSEQLDVTRERVRQIETRVRKHIASCIDGKGPAASLSHLAARTRREIGPMAEQESAIAIVDSMVRGSSDAPPAHNLRRNILLALAGPYVDEAGVLMSKAAIERLDVVRSMIAELEPGASLPEGLFSVLVEELQIPPTVSTQIERRIGIRLVNGTHVVWRGSMVDKAVSVLAAYGQPMAMGDLHEAVGFEINPRSLANTLPADRRIMRRGKEHFGLRSWGGEEYSGITDELEQAIDGAGGRVDLEATVATFVREFGVSAGSVRSYATDRRFIRDRDGSLRFRTDDDPLPAPRGRPINETRGAFLLGGRWHLRLEVDHELLRGSGRMISTSIAMAAGLEPDLTLGFDYGGGSVTFSWSRGQPALGTLRSTALAHDCVEGDLLFLPLAGSEPRVCRTCRVAERNSVATGTRRLALEIGLDPERVDVDDPAILGGVLGLPLGADWEAVGDRLRDRGEDELAALLPLDPD